MKWRSKVQSLNGKLFVYLPTAQCIDEKIVKGSKIYCEAIDSGLPPEPPKKKGFWPSVKKTEDQVKEG